MRIKIKKELDIMNATVIGKAYDMIGNAGQSLAPETSAILTLLATSAHAAALQDDTLFLDWISRLLGERFNISFSENSEDYEKYFKDCLQLKDIMEANASPSTRETWLSCTVTLLENLKTPYYDSWSCAQLIFYDSFSDDSITDRLLKDFYSVIIKSTEEKQEIIRQIIRRIPAFKKYPFLSEALISQLTLHNLAIFGNEKEYWLPAWTSLLYGIETSSDKEIHTPALLRDYFSREDAFLEENASASLPSLPDYLACRDAWFRTHPAKPSDNVLYLYGADTERQVVRSEFLNKFAYNMTARPYITNPAISRETEISDLELILISPKKSPILIGEAGVGKTSVVEGLAWLLQRGDVPELLKNKKIFKLTTTSLLSGTKYVGKMEDRIKQMTDELRAHPEVILFIDEIHTIVGAGSTESSHNDISNMLKPFIDRGDIKIIGATTREEYEHFLLPDRALARRFYPIQVEEPSKEMTLEILKGSIPSIEHDTKVKNRFSEEDTDRCLWALIRISAPENQPEGQITRLPELPLSILEMAFAFAALNRRQELSFDDIKLAIQRSSRLTKEIRTKIDTYFG